MISPLQVLKDAGFKPISDLNYCLDNGIEYYIGYYKAHAAVVAIITDENTYFIDKEGLREMSLTAKIAGINEVWLYTNYGIELHSRYEKPSVVGFNHIVKINNEGKHYFN